MANPAFQALLLLCWCRGKESNRQRAAAEAQLKWVFVRGEVSLLSRTNVCACLHLKSQSRDNMSVPLSVHRHRVQWRLWRARRLLGCSSMLKFSTRTLLVWYGHFEKVSGWMVSFSQAPLPAHISQVGFWGHLHYFGAVSCSLVSFQVWFSESSSLAQICRLWNAW